jgi:hypothetical protein
MWSILYCSSMILLLYVTVGRMQPIQISCFLEIWVSVGFNICFSNTNTFHLYHQRMVCSFLTLHISILFHILKTLILAEAETLQVYNVLHISPQTIIWRKIMSTIVQQQYDKCECPNWSIGPEWWGVFFFFQTNVTSNLLQQQWTAKQPVSHGSLQSSTDCLLNHSLIASATDWDMLHRTKKAY